MESNANNGVLDRGNAAHVYVGFLDVLGFGRRVLTDFDEALEAYNKLFDIVERAMPAQGHPELCIKLLSDAFVVTSPHLADVVGAANILQFAALAGQNCLLRGGIGHGLHVEKASDGNVFVVSEPLVRAVVVEKTIKYPCVALDPSVLPDPIFWFHQPTNILRPLLYLDGRWVVNPCGIMWGDSAAERVRQLEKQYPEHSDKCQWFLNLYNKIFDVTPLIPSAEQWAAMGGIVDQNKLPRMPPSALLALSSTRAGAAEVEEWEPTAEQLAEYYAVYTNGDVKHLRTVFDDATAGKEDGETRLLRGFEPYLARKFTVMSRDPVSDRGSQITILFQGQADALFRAWIHQRSGGASGYELRRFQREYVSKDKLAWIVARYHRFLEDPEHAM